MEDTELPGLGGLGGGSAAVRFASIKLQSTNIQAPIPIHRELLCCACLPAYSPAVLTALPSVRLY